MDPTSAYLVLREGSQLLLDGQPDSFVFVRVRLNSSPQRLLPLRLGLPPFPSIPVSFLSFCFNYYKSMDSFLNAFSGPDEGN